VIAYAYERKLCDGRLSFRRFLVLRAIRLLPLIAVGAILGAVATASVIAPAHLPKTLLALPFALLLIPIPPQLAAEPFALNAPAWSLFFEVCANILYAAIVGVLGYRRLALLVLLSGIGLVAIAIKFDGALVG